MHTKKKYKLVDLKIEFNNIITMHDAYDGNADESVIFLYNLYLLWISPSLPLG